MSDLDTLFPQSTDYVLSGNGVTIHALQIRQLAHAARLAEKISSHHQQTSTTALLELILLLTTATTAQLEQCSDRDLIALFDAIIAVNRDFFHPASDDDPITEQPPAHDWGYVLQKLRLCGHSEPETYTIKQVQCYLSAIALCEQERIKNAALAARVGFNATPEQWQQFNEELT